MMAHQAVLRGPNHCILCELLNGRLICGDVLAPCSGGHDRMLPDQKSSCEWLFFAC